jgi:hypothetical protein
MIKYILENEGFRGMVCIKVKSMILVSILKMFQAIFLPSIQAD